MASPMDAGPSSGHVTDIVDTAMQLNSSLYQSINNRLARLESELKEVDELTKDVEQIDESQLPQGEVQEETWSVETPGSCKPSGVLTRTQLLDSTSPFLKDAEKRLRYVDLITQRPFTTKEREALQKHIEWENKRLHVLAGPGPDSDEPSQDFLRNNVQGIDWNRVAKSVSAESGLTRSAALCQLRWKNNLHPQINTSNWTKAEEKSLESLVASFGTGYVHWEDVAEKLGTHRTTIACIKKAFKLLNTAVHEWTDEMDTKLKAAIEKYGDNNWYLVALAVGHNTTIQQCAERWMQRFETIHSRGAWSPEEDELLRQGVDRFGIGDWKSISSFVGLRSNVQCRDRWNNAVDPILKRGPWSQEEDWTLREAVETVRRAAKLEGDEFSWQAVSVHLEGTRTGASCKARYELLVDKATSEQPEGSTSTTTRKGKQVVEPADVGDQPPPKPKAQRKPRATKKAAEDTTRVEDADATGSATPDPAPTTRAPRKTRVKKSDKSPDEPAAQSPVPQAPTAEAVAKPKRPRAKPRKKVTAQEVVEPSTAGTGPDQNVIQGMK
ncbi:hypothetical protein SISSUDRAFT_1065902 [Sistotremastrum suecicum HHB10207 ss-3]|uniref:Uncharacterized protein n=1 Tax=Sistotremastrum suecicum HHB10207 ss-3 TaxID=1314776 RepID=A0A165YXY4_9AGAM|nr:hypothetical protein SISSUDRAFT_1065902 [Sistotremastrum suecicum HHB10207 ss-3]